jgi:hypothetical protein
MHEAQKRLIELARSMDISVMTLEEIGRNIGIYQRQGVYFHIQQLKRKRLLPMYDNAGTVKGLQQFARESRSNLISIPIVGAANCGVATLLADQSIEGYLNISQKLVESRNLSKLIAVRAVGKSLNRATINKQSVEEGDLLIIDTESCQPSCGEYILSIINGCANIKKYQPDLENNRIVLLSESTEKFDPIYIHPEDDYLINGKVIQVIKNFVTT